MKRILLIALIFLPMVGMAQVNTVKKIGSTSGISKMDSTVVVDILSVDNTPTYVLSGEDGFLHRIETETVNFGHAIQAYSAGTVYILTNSAALLDFGTTDPSIILDQAGTYLILCGGNFKLNAATFAANQTITCKLRRTNNTAADITNAVDVITLPIVTTTTNHAGTCNVPHIIYTTTNTTDNLQLFGSLSATPSAGTVSCQSAFILAVKLY
jgi:hypothetical protein